eukprot:tig00021763_g23509.t1
MALADSYPPHYSLGALAATLTWLLGGTPTASAVIGVGFGYAAKTLYAPGSVSMATAGMRPAGQKLLCTVFKSDSRCSKIGEAAKGGGAKAGGGAEGPKIRGADPAPPALKSIKAAGKGRGVGPLPLVAIAPGQREAAHAATAALASQQQREGAPRLSAGLWSQPAPAREYGVSAYFDGANELSRQEIWAWEARRAVDGHLPLLVALGGSLLMVWYLRGFAI